MFLVIYTSLMLIIFNNDFRMVKYVIALFLIDFTIRVFINPKFSPSLIIGRLIVGNQVPEYVGAQQKKFAWVMGVSLSAPMFVFLVPHALRHLVTHAQSDRKRTRLISSHLVSLY